MRAALGTALSGMMLLGSGCGPGQTASLDTEDQKASYSIGVDMGTNLLQVANRIDLAALQKGIEDGISEAELLLTPEERDVIMQAFSQRFQEDQAAEMEAEGQANQAEGAAYMEGNAAREGVVVTESGLQYEVLREGEGARPTTEQSVTVHYKGTLVDGTQFDSSYDRGEPATFAVTQVISGFSEGLQLMTVGSHYRFVIPGEIAYGLQPPPGGGLIGPNETLIFEVELLEIPQ